MLRFALSHLLHILPDIVGLTTLMEGTTNLTLVDAVVSESQFYEKSNALLTQYITAGANNILSYFIDGSVHTHIEKPRYSL